MMWVFGSIIWLNALHIRCSSIQVEACSNAINWFLPRKWLFRWGMTFCFFNCQYSLKAALDYLTFSLTTSFITANHFFLDSSNEWRDNASRIGFLFTFSNKTTRYQSRGLSVKHILGRHLYVIIQRRIPVRTLHITIYEPTSLWTQEIYLFQ